MTIRVLLLAACAACVPAPKAPAEMKLGPEDGQCRAGDVAACTKLRTAYLHEAEHTRGDARPFREKALEYADLGCKVHDPESCRYYLEEVSDLRSWKFGKEEASRVSAAMCDARPNYDWCRRAAHADGAPRTDEAGRAYMIRSCEHVEKNDDGMSCHDAGTAARKANPPEPARALEYYDRLCDLDDASGCHEAGLMLLGDKGLPRDELGAMDELAKACKLDNRRCDELVTLTRTMCERGDMESCTTMAGAYREGDPVRAKALYERACKAGHKPACTALERWQSP